MNFRMLAAFVLTLIAFACAGCGSGEGGKLEEPVFLNCPECAEEGIPINIWSSYGADRGQTIEQLPDGWPVKLAYIKNGDDGRPWAHIIYCTSGNRCDNGYVPMSFIRRQGAAVSRPAPTATRRVVVSPTPASVTGPPQAIADTQVMIQPKPGVEVVGMVVAGELLDLVAKTADGRWLQVAAGGWVHSAMVANIPADLPVAGLARATATPEPSATPTRIPGNATARGAANLRVAPDQDAEIVGRVEARQSLALVGVTADGMWLKTADNLWILAQVVRNIPAGLPEIDILVTPAPATPSN